MSVALHSSKSIKVIDKPSKKQIKFDFVIFLDDTIDSIKRKICAVRNSPKVIPEFSRIYIKDEKSNSLKLTNKYKEGGKGKEATLLDYTSDGFFSNEIYFENGYDLLEKDAKNFKKDKVDTSSEEFQELFNLYKTEFPEINETKFFLFLKGIKGLPTGTVISGFNRDEIVNQMKDETITYNQIPTNAINSEVVKKLAPTRIINNKFSNRTYKFNIINCLVKIDTTPEEKLNSKGKKPKVVDLQKLFNGIETSEELPYVSVGTDKKGAPVAKVHSSLQGMDPKRLNTWVLSGDSSRLKRPKGMIIKYKGAGSNKFSSINLMSTGEISIRCTWSSSDDAYVTDVYDCITKINDLIDKVNSYPVALNRSLNKISFSKISITSLNSNMTFNMGIDKKMLKNELSANYSKFFGEIQQQAGSTISLKYIRNLNKYDPKDTGTSISIKGKDKLFVDIFSSSSMGETFLIYDLITAAFVALYEKGSAIPVASTSRSKTKLGDLKSLGIPTDSEKCVKKRQPVVDIEGKIKPLKKDSYKINVNGYDLVCTNKDYPYPGYLSSGVPCCFTRDQRKKPSFKIFDSSAAAGSSSAGGASGGASGGITSAEMLEYEEKMWGINRYDKPDNFFVNPSLMKTQKLLDQNRIGVLPKYLHYLFNAVVDLSDLQNENPKNMGFVRFGVGSPDVKKRDFLDAILPVIFKESNGVIVSKTKLKKDITDYASSMKNFLTLNNGDINKKYKKRDYINTIKRNPRVDLVLDLVSKMIGLNIFVFSESPAGIMCSQGYHRLSDFFTPGRKTVFILKKKEGAFEPIVLYNAVKKDWQILFDSDSGISKLVREFYEMVCQSKGTLISISSAKELSSQIGKENLSAQIINQFGEVSFLVTKSNELFPVRPTAPEPDLKIITFENLKNLKKSAVETVGYLNKSGIVSMRVISQAVTTTGVKDDKISTVGIQTESGLMVPTNPSSIIRGIDILEEEYTEDFDEILIQKQKGPIWSESKENRILAEHNFFISMIHQYRLEMAHYINKPGSDPEKKLIMDTFKDKSLNPEGKRNVVKGIVENAIQKVSIFDMDLSRKSRLKGYSEVLKKREPCALRVSEKECNASEFCRWDPVEKVCKIGVLEKFKESIITLLTNELITSPNEILDSTVPKDLLEESVKFVARPDEFLLFDPKDVQTFTKVIF